MSRSPRTTRAARQHSSPPDGARPDASACHLRLLSRPEWVEPVASSLRARAIADGVCGEAAADRLVVALTEALTNAIVHGNFGLPSSLKLDDAAFDQALRRRADDPAWFGKVVDVRVERLPDGGAWTVTDEGDGFDVDAALRRLDSDELDFDRPSGRGLAIMRAFVDEVSWADGGRQVRLVLRPGSVNRRGSDRRRYVEALAYELAGHEPAGPGGSVRRAIARDLSETGLAFVTTESLPVGRRVRLTLDADRPTRRDLSAVIVRSRHVAGDFYDTAARFDRPLGGA